MIYETKDLQEYLKANTSKVFSVKYNKTFNRLVN